MKRLFVAIKVNPDEQFIQHYSGFRHQLFMSRITWVEPSLMHMTLKFLGKTDDHQIPIISDVLDKVAVDYDSFRFSLDHLGIFGSSYQPKVIWLGSSQPSPMTKLGNDIIGRFHEAGFLSDRQNFVPHLSLGRIKKVDNKKYFQEVMEKYRNCMQQSLHIKEIKLYQSILRPSGPIYQQIRAFNLKTNI